jgi:hypothetical protein
VTKPQPAEQDALAKARSGMMTGAMLVMGACVFGGLTAVVLMALGQKTGAGAVAVVAGLVIIAGVVVQLSAAKKLKAASQKAGPK